MKVYSVWGFMNWLTWHEGVILHWWFIRNLSIFALNVLSPVELAAPRNAANAVSPQLKEVKAITFWKLIQSPYGAFLSNVLEAKFWLSSFTSLLKNTANVLMHKCYNNQNPNWKYLLILGDIVVKDTVLCPEGFCAVPLVSYVFVNKVLPCSTLP